jgi:hypothetical protein
MDVYTFTSTPILYLTFPILVFLILANWLGYRFRKYQIKKNPGIDKVGLGPTEGSILGLTALLLSFAFGMTASKFEARRQLIVEEANDIGTVILRCDLYNDSVRQLFRSDLKEYLEARINYYDVGDNGRLIQKSLYRSDSVASVIWKRASNLGHNLENRVATAQMVPALNSMFDIVSTREASRIAVVPRVIMSVLGLMTLISSFLSGYGSKKVERNKVLIIAFCIMTTLALYLVFELDRPRQGIINLNGSEKFMTALRKNL